jgi:WD40 repeat protein
MSTLTGRLLVLACVAVAVPAPARADMPAKQDKKPPEAKKPRTDRYGDPLPEGAIARIGTVRWRHARMTLIGYRPDGKTMISVSLDSIRLWDSTTGTKLKEMPLNVETLDCATLSRDGTILALADSKDILVYDVNTGKRVNTIKVTERWLDCLVVSPDGKALAARTEEGSISLWDLTTGKKLREIVQPKLDSETPDISGGRVEWPNSLAFSADGKHIAGTHNTGVLTVWQVGTGKEIRHSQGEQRLGQSVVFAPNGKVLAWYKKARRMSLVGATTGKELHVLRGFEFPVVGLAISPDSKTLASVHMQDYDFEVLLWDVATGKKLHKLAGDTYGIYRVAFSPDGKTIAACNGAFIQRWDVATGKEKLPPDGNLGLVDQLAVAPDGKTLATISRESAEGNIWLWDLATHKRIRQVGKRGEAAPELAFSPDCKILASQNDEKETVTLWDVASGKQKSLLAGAGLGWGGMAFSADGSAFISARCDGLAGVWDAATGKVLCRFQAPFSEQPQRDVVIDAHGRTLDWYGNGTAQAFESRTGRSFPQFRLSHAEVYNAALSLDGKTLAAWVQGTRIDRDKQVVVDRRKPPLLYLVETATGKERCRFKGIREDLYHPAFSPDGTLLTAVVEGTIRLWDVASSKELARFEGHESSISGLVFFPDGTKLASSSWDTTVLVWDLTTLKRREKPPTVELSTRQLDSLWADLAGDDAPKAYRAISNLTAAKASASLLKDKLQQAGRAALKRQERIPALLADLDAESFKVRDKASRDLAELGDLAEPMLRQALAQKLSVESRRRVEGLLEKLNGTAPHSDTLRMIRAIEALERMATPEARQVLETLTKGPGEPRLNEEAKASLARLAKRLAVKP